VDVRPPDVFDLPPTNELVAPEAAACTLISRELSECREVHPAHRSVATRGG
jgi:hypothetical protein